MTRLRHRYEVNKILDIFWVNVFDATDRLMEDIDDVFDESYEEYLSNYNRYDD